MVEKSFKKRSMKAFVTDETMTELLKNIIVQSDEDLGYKNV